MCLSYIKKHTVGKTCFKSIKLCRFFAIKNANKLNSINSKCFIEYCFKFDDWFELLFVQLFLNYQKKTRSINNLLSKIVFSFYLYTFNLKSNIGNCQWTFYIFFPLSLNSQMDYTGKYNDDVMLLPLVMCDSF